MGSGVSLVSCTHSNGSTRQTPQVKSVPHALQHQVQQIEIIMLLVFYCTSMLCVAVGAASLGSSLALNGSTTLHWNETLVSEDRQFAVGFFHNSMMPEDIGYNLAIWYAKLPNVTTVWMPDTSIMLSCKAMLSLSKEGVLQLHDGISQGSNVNVLWRASTQMMNVTIATILNTGNFVLYNKTNHIVWQSFAYPTNTLLPNQRYFSNNKIVMHSWTNENNYTAGQYNLGWNSFNYLDLKYFSPIYSPYSSQLLTYWSTWNPFLSHFGSSYPIPSLSKVGNLQITSVILTSDGEFQAWVVPNINNIIGKSIDNSSNYLYRITLDIDGQLRMYSWKFGVSNNWNIEWSALSYTCNIYGWCGPFAICVAGDCQCPQGFHWIDITNKRTGCTRIKSPYFCNSSIDIKDNLVPIPVDYPWTLDIKFFENVSVEYCKIECLNECSCQCATISNPNANGYVSCWLKGSTFNNGQYHNNRISYMRMAPILSNVVKNEKKLPCSIARLIAFICSPLTIIFGMISCVSIYTYFCKRFSNFQLQRLESKWTSEHGTLMKFSSKEIRLMTNNFLKEIGKGGSGTVYKGKIGRNKIPKRTIAIKRLNRLDVDEKEFINEVDIVGRIHHANLVHLLGYCLEKNQRVFVYEYIEHQSLDKILFQNIKTKNYFVLDWKTRCNIAIQTAKGLAYLHNDVREKQIIHCDIKPENILLDSAFCAKIADFGISRIIKKEQNSTMTRQIRGTFGYLAPEWTSNQMSITTKTDVYSYGMVLLEIVGGRRNLKQGSSDSSDQDFDWYFPLWAYSKLNSIESIFEVLDPLLQGFANPSELERVLKVAFWCINEQPQLRPSMTMVVQMLEGHMIIELPVPQPKFLFDMLTSFENEDGIDIH